MSDIIPITQSTITPTKLVPYSAGAAGVFGADGLSFKDVLDTVNPLQQLPIVGSLYRSATGDTISTASQLAGGAILGGPVGLLMAAGGALFEALAGAAPIDKALSIAGDVATPDKASKFYLKAKELG